MATIIKASDPHGAADATRYNLEDVVDRAKACLEQARRQATEILAQAEQDASGIRQQAEEEGRAAAFDAVERILDEKVDRRFATLMPALNHAIDEIASARTEWLLHWEKAAVHVASAIAGRVVRQEVVRRPQITLALVKEALELAAGSTDIRLRLHPEDVAALGAQVERLTAELTRLGPAQIVSDPRIEQGGCRVETRFGSIDQQFDAQLGADRTRIDVAGERPRGRDPSFVSCPPLEHRDKCPFNRRSTQLPINSKRRSPPPCAAASCARRA